MEYAKKKLIFCFNYGNLAEFLEILHEFEGGLTGACAGCFVTLNYLSLSVDLEGLDVGVDFFNKFFHKIKVLKCYWCNSVKILPQFRK